MVVGYYWSILIFNLNNLLIFYWYKFVIIGSWFLFLRCVSITCFSLGFWVRDEFLLLKDGTKTWIEIPITLLNIFVFFFSLRKGKNTCCLGLDYVLTLFWFPPVVVSWNLQFVETLGSPAAFLLIFFLFLVVFDLALCPPLCSFIHISLIIFVWEKGRYSRESCTSG